MRVYTYRLNKNIKQKWHHSKYQCELNVNLKTQSNGVLVKKVTCDMLVHVIASDIKSVKLVDI